MKILEDPNHGWFKEQFSSLAEIPRSRYEFVIALYEEHKRLREKDPEAAKLTNIRWTGTLPYAAQENYERMKAAMRRYRSAKAANQDTRFVEMEIASYMGRLGHYTGDGAQPLHDRFITMAGPARIRKSTRVSRAYTDGSNCSSST